MLDSSQKEETDQELIEIMESTLYKEADIKTQNKLLLQAIHESLKQIQKEEKTPSKNIEDKQKKEQTLVTEPTEKKVTKQKCKKEENDYSNLENISLEELIYHLPKKEENDFQNKINIRMCYLRSLIDSYDSLLLEKTIDEEMIQYIKDARKNLETKLEYLKSYAQVKEQVEELEQLENIKIIYFTYYGQNLFLNDLLKEDTAKFPSYLLLLNSIKEQTFKGVKRINKTNIRVFEVRYREQRILFDILNENTIIIIYAFTKKVLSDKKYRLNLDNRIEKYLSTKKEIKERYMELSIDAQEEDRKIMELLTTKNKKMVKEKKDNKIWKN